MGPSSMAASTLCAASFGPPNGYSVFGSSPRQIVSELKVGVGVTSGGTTSLGLAVGVEALNGSWQARIRKTRAMRTGRSFLIIRPSILRKGNRTLQQGDVILP